MSIRIRRGFTLAELMVAVAIIALLVAILLPMFTNAFALQRRAQCASNLHQIGVACGTRIANLGQGVVGQVPAFGWQDGLRGLLGRDKSVYICPEDKDPAPDPAGGLKGICIEVSRSGAYYWDVYLDQANSDEWIWKMSRTQYNEFMAVSGEGKTTPYKATYMKTGYVEDNDPYTVYFTFEDTAPAGGGDQDFYDVVLEVHYSEAKIDFAVKVRASGMSFALCKKDPARTVLIPDLRVGQTASIPYYGGECSYGINSVSSRIIATRQKLLGLDYEYSVAIGSNFDTTTERAKHLAYWYPDKKDAKVPPTFARHLRKVNVLLADGTVYTLSRDAINPNDPEIARQLWDP